MAELLLINGPNLNMLGTREPSLYGHTTLPEVEAQVKTLVENAGHQLHSIQSNAEHVLVEWLQAHREADFLLLNAAAFTHTSVALRDAISMTGIPFIEIHISNVYQRESFRKKSWFSDIAVGVVAGLGVYGYQLAAQYALQALKQSSAKG